MDLAFVISIAALTTMLVHNPTLGGLGLYLFLFFAVFWAWNQLTWYSTLFDNDDVFFRVMYLSAILSVLILAAAIGQISEGHTTLFVISYLLLQTCLAAGWSRVLIGRHELRWFSLEYLMGQVMGGAVWLLSLGFPVSQQYYFWVVAVAVHIAAPYVAWKTTSIDIPIHQNHIVERYCLLTIIVLGETLIVVSMGMGSAPGSEVFLTALFGFVLAACIWWTYFNWDFSDIKQWGAVSNLFFFGYGHFVVYLAIGAFGAGVEIASHSAAHGGHLTLLARMLIALSPSMYLLSLSLMNMSSWNMSLDRQMGARIGVAVWILALPSVLSHASPSVYTGVVALSMVCLVVFEQVVCAKPSDS
jgi:low temperature requirement protein LtrA